MPKLVRFGKTLYEGNTRADCLVRAFELGLVYDRFARGKTNTLLPGVSVVGSDGDNSYEEASNA